MKNILEIDGVELSYNGRTVLNNIYIKSETGTVTAILGHNGCGKSSLFNLIFGEGRAKEKSVRINGKMLNDTYRDPADMSMLPQFNFIPKGRKVKSVFKDFDLCFHAFSNRFPLFKEYEDLKVKELSGGSIRIIELYLVLKSKSKFCILDEPFTHISHIEIVQLKELINEAKQTKGILIADHQHKYIKQISDAFYI